MLKENETVTLWNYCNTAKKYILWVCLRVHVWIYRFTSRWYFLSVWENQSLLNVNYLSGQMGLIFICDIFFFFCRCVARCSLVGRSRSEPWQKKNNRTKKDKAQWRDCISPLQTRLFVSLVHCVPRRSPPSEHLQVWLVDDDNIAGLAPCSRNSGRGLNSYFKAFFHLFNVSFCLTGMPANTWQYFVFLNGPALSVSLCWSQPSDFARLSMSQVKLIVTEKPLFPPKTVVERNVCFVLWGPCISNLPKIIYSIWRRPQ